MPKFAYNNANNASISYILFKLKYNNYLCIFFEDNTDPCLKFQSTNKLVNNLRDLILIYL